MVFGNKDAKKMLDTMKQHFSEAWNWFSDFLVLFTGPWKYVIWAIIVVIIIIIVGIT